MGNRKSPVQYNRMNHYHLIYTPKTLGDLLIDSLPYARFCASEEVGQGGRHYHIYIETDVSEDTVRDRLKRCQLIPQGARGRKSLYYSCRPVEPHPAEFPDQDLRKFTLGYTLKNQTIEPNDSTTFRGGYTNQELIEAQKYYQDTNFAAKRRQEQL